MKAPLPSGSSALPPLYTAWMEDLLQAPIEEESEATCSDCVMCVTKQTKRTPDDHLFNLHTKCCTYIPRVPNFLVGKILLDNDPSAAKGRAAFEAYLRDRADVRPQGLFPHNDFVKNYSSDPQVFGRNQDMKCPFYLEEEGGLCGIWKHRTAICSTWFCKHVRGDTGKQFWKRVENLLGAVQISLSHWCMHQLEAGTEEFRRCFPYSEEPDMFALFDRQIFYYENALFNQMKDPSAFLEFRQRIWGKWFEKESEYFEACARLVAPLRWKEVLSIGTAPIARLANEVKAAFGAIAIKEVPQVLHPGTFKVVDLDEIEVRVWSYSEFDTVDLPKSILPLIAYFDGSPTTQVLNRIEKDSGVRLESDLLRKLIDFKVLVERR